MLRPQSRAILDGSLRPPVLFSISEDVIEYPAARSGSATAMSIPFAPEPEPVGEVLQLGDDQPTGSLPLGFEFEFFGARYACFDLSSDGFMRFRAATLVRSSGAYRHNRVTSVGTDLYSAIALGWSDLYPLRRRRLAYEVRGDTCRRRLVLSLTGAPSSFERDVRRLMAQLILYERTGMIDVHTRCDDATGQSLNREALRFTTAPW